MNKEAIIAGVAKSWEVLAKAKCPLCEGKLTLLQQKAKLNKEVNEMADFMKCVCFACRIGVTFIIPQPHLTALKE
jgi:hypothetical protein